MADSSGDQQEAAISSSKALSATTHPLQDVALNMDEEGDLFDDVPAPAPPQQQQQQQKAANKQNWVKFDDEVSENNNKSGGVDGGGSQITTPAAIDSIDNATRATTATTAAATAAAATNKLSPIPPPVAKRQTVRSVSPTTSTTTTMALSSSALPRPRTPVESASMPQQQQQQQAEAPVQRAAVSSSTSMPDVAPAVLNTESTHVNLNASGRTQHQSPHQQQLQQHHPHSQQQHQQQHQKPKAASGAAATQSSQHTQLPHHSNNGTSSSAMHKSTNVAIPVESAPGMRTIELSTGRIREGFANGDVIVTLLPANTKWPWITPAIFRPELVPEELMAQGLTLTVEEYVNAMETLVNDYRFTVYNICYKRILVCWILFAFAVLLTLLFSGLQGVALFSLGVGWLFLNAAAIFLCMWVKLRLSRGLEKCLARVNRQLMKHKILLILDDRGRISCHKVNLCFLYFDATQCVSFLNEFLEHTEQNGGEAIKAGWESKLDIDVNDIVIQGNNPVRLSRKQVVAQEIFLSYLQRWGKDFLRRRLDWTVQEAGVHETPRHLQSSICPCQYEEEILRNKIKMQLKGRQCCGLNCIGCWL